ncbi:hypothetical protein VTJ83DRAFT_330 [Remersonia thermophila]|uniref:Transcriptional regulatory protein DEP1 n=1 Tax=Remersonia thermophila TaxID=72144 RepID=A0ABR4DN50_9PEZI
MAPSSPPPAVRDNSPSNLSSPLSEPEDKDGYGDEPDLDIRDPSDANGTPNQNGRAGHDSDAASDSDDSKLSDVDVDDSEAETERLYNTPPKNGATRDGVGARRFTDRPHRVFERSPSKLQQQLRADIEADDGASDRTSVFEKDEADDDNGSLPSSDADLDRNVEPRLSTKKGSTAPSKETPTSHPKKNSIDSRKRKRSVAADNSEAEEPLKKRPSSVATADRDSTGDVVMAEDDEASVDAQRGDNNAEDDAEEPTDAKEELADAVEEDVAVPSRSRKGQRNLPKKRKSQSPEETSTKDEAPDEPPEDVDTNSVEVPTPQIVEEDHADEIDEEAEAAHRNEEEMERKKAAWEELVAIEKQFSSFRERLYQERLDQLNREEAMLTGDNPTHPVYLAMLQCLQERRDEKIRRSDVELQLKLSVLRHRAVAERAQIMSQFYQAVRESRDEAVAELGQEWYQIQHERRRAANTIPDYGLRFPASRPQAIRNAVSYNREVSILSGFAKHVGFPAAPAINGATEDQLEADLEAIQALRESLPRPHTHQLPPFRPDYPAGISSFAHQGLGPAEQQFIEQTPWANPNHPSHHMQRQQAFRDRTFQPTYAGSSTVAAAPSASAAAQKRQYNNGQHAPAGLYAQGAPPPTTVTSLNGDSTSVAVTQMAQKPTHSSTPAAPEPSLKGKLVQEGLRREAPVHAS